MNKFVSTLAIAAIVFGFGAPALPARAAMTALSLVQSGDLIRGETFPAVYYMGKDGFRYVFPNDKTFFTWYTNFDSVKWLTDADLAKIQIGGNVTYKPGVKMIKINSDPKTYAVDEGGTLRWVTSESVAVALFGSNWNTKIDDVPDAFFSNYNMGADIEVPEDFAPTSVSTSVMSINEDKDLQSPTVIEITDNAFSDTSITIEAGTAVKFVNNGSNKHTATADDESWGTGTLNSGDSFSRYFKTSGEWDFHCNYHSSMTATITVE
jgi:plastocyanin